MIPSIGYFLVVPKIGPKWINFKEEILKQIEELKDNTDEQSFLERYMPTYIERFGWSFCFVNETELFFQNELTRDFEAKYGDLQLKIREQEFYLVSMIEKEIMKDQNLNELLKLDNYFTLLDAFLSLVQSA